MLKFGSKSDVTVVHRATIRLLDDAEIIHCDFKPQHKGKFILEYVCKQLNILETDYFGLRYVDSCRQRHWLDLAKTAIKQVKDTESILFSFRVKFYPPDPLRLKEEITRYQIYQQLKRDLLHGRLYCSPGEAALLAACIVQSELGDYDPEIHEGNYIGEHKLLLKQTEAIEEKALELHQTQLKGFTPEQAETHFLRLASQLDTYAVDPHPVKDHKGTPLYLGINHCGILTFQGSRKTNHFRWPEVQKINYEGKMFIVHLTITEDMRTKKKHTVGFKCPTGSNCRHVWRCAIEQMLFFTLPRASDAPVMSGGSIFSWGTKFKYTGRTEREVLEETGPLRKEEPPIQRCHSTGLRRKASSVPATPSTPSQDLVEILCQHDYDSDYYFRDSFDHSSSESQLLEAKPGGVHGSVHGSSRSIAPVPKMQRLQNSKICNVGQTALGSTSTALTAASSAAAAAARHRGQMSPATNTVGNIANSRMAKRTLRVVKLFIPALMLTITVLFIVTVLVFETDSKLFEGLRKTPEMVALRAQYYAPIKDFLKTKLGLF
ncbi:FERM domain-containing protein 5 isoform X8 [Nasonia vitripennis]|uniref:FERM domain-containing protein n=1 Tax=Nasonia vitripennis TaxID=7425 RepID=A0A7M7Q8S0_NASVI|nr:FERM domain-containing protein 5 isoform X8 [Nasonia vitripennis]